MKSSVLNGRQIAHRAWRRSLEARALLVQPGTFDIDKGTPAGTVVATVVIS
jgi:hypothetical protein